MKPTETSQVLIKIQAFNNRTFDQANIAAWHETIGDLALRDCLLAVAEFFKASTDWIMPADIRRLVRGIRAERIEAIGHVPELRDDHLDVPPSVWKSRQQHLLGVIASGQLSREDYEAYHAHQIELPGAPKGLGK